MGKINNSLGNLLIVLGTCYFAEANQSQGRIIHGKYFGPLNETLIFPKNVSRAQIETGFFSQPLDHFNASDNRSWNQKFVRNNTYFHAGGPACIFLGGEGPLDSHWVTVSQIVLYCRQINGVIYGLEHRFYGKSQPLPDATVESLKYLSISQALHDIARFVEFVRLNEQHKNGKIILFGGSYSATLAVYFKQKFGSFVDIGVASSGPLSWRYDFKEYLEVVGRVLRNHSQGCYDKIESGMRQLETIVLKAMDNSDDEPINSKLAPLRLCDDLYVNSTIDVESFFAEITGIFSYYTQYNGVNLLIMSMREVCQEMTRMSRIDTRTDFEILARILNSMNDFLQKECFDFLHENFCDHINKTDWKDDAVKSGSRLWRWQVCNEVGSFQTTNSENQPFTGLSTALFVAECQCAFGHKYTEKFIQNSVDRHLKIYGEFDVVRPKIIYTNGQHDPWAALGVNSHAQIHGTNNYPTSLNCVIVISEASHCNDLLMDKPTFDSVALQNARNETLKCIRNWL